MPRQDLHHFLQIFSPSLGHAWVSEFRVLSSNRMNYIPAAVQTYEKLAPYAPEIKYLAKEAKNFITDKYRMYQGRKKVPNKQLRRYQGPLLPGGEYAAGPNMSASTRSFLARAVAKRPGQSKRKRIARVSSGVVQGKGFDAPVNFSNTVCTQESDFRRSSVPTTSHGPGIACSFSVALTNMGTNGNTTTNTADFQNGIAIAAATNLGNTLNPSGFISSDSNWATGLLIHPTFLGVRLNRETNNWTEWQPQILKFSYQNQVATSTTGSFTLCFTRDPDAFLEAGGTQTTPTHSFGNVSQTVPNCSTNAYKDMSMTINRWDRTKYFPCEVTTGSPFAQGQTIGTIAYNSTHYCGRLVGMYNGPAQNLGTTGILWVSGVIRFYGPSASNLTIGTTTTSLSLLETPVAFFRGKWRTISYMRQLHAHFEQLALQNPHKYEEIEFKTHDTKVQKQEIKIGSPILTLEEKRSQPLTVAPPHSELDVDGDVVMKVADTSSSMDLLPEDVAPFDWNSI